MVQVRSNIPEKAQEYLQELLSETERVAYRAAVKTSLVGESRVKGIMQKEAYDTGRLLRSVTSEIKQSPDELKLIIGSNLEYAVTVEYGRKKGKWPNLTALVKWTGRKLREKGINARVNITFDQLKQMAGGKRKNGQASKQSEIARKHLSFVYAVGMNISKKGIKEKLIFKRIEDGLLGYFRNELQKELQSLR